MTVIVVARLVQRARIIAAERNLGRLAIPVSPRSIRDGAVRGRCGVSEILVDASAWPLDEDVREELAFTTVASPTPVVPTLIP